MIKLNLQRLEETAEMGKALIRRLPGAGLLVVDTTLRILMIDGDAHRYLDQDTVVGRRVPDVIPAAAWEVLEQRYLAALDGHVQSFDYEAVGDGSVHSIRLAPIHDDTAVIGVMSLSQDITARAAATLRLAESERSHRSVLEALDEGVIVLDLEGRPAEANGAACAILGLDLASARAGPSWWEPFAARHAGDGSPLDVGETVFRTGRGVRDVEVEVDRSDGTSALLSLNHQPLHDTAGAVSGLVLSFRDVTQRQRERRHLVEIQERLREAHEVARLASWEWQPETDEVLVFQALEGDEALTGTRARVEDLFAAIPPEVQKTAREDLTSIVRGESDQSVRRYCQPGLAGPVWLELRCRAVRDDARRLLCVRGTSQDVTEQQLAKQAAARSRDFFQATLDSLPAHVAVLDEQGEIVMTNRAWVEFAAANDPPGST